MNDEARHAAVAALIKLSESPDYRDRADAGRALASFAAMPEAKGPLLGLVLDADNTFVTRETAEALLRRLDAAGLAVVAAALGDADPNQGDWIYTAVDDVFVVDDAERDAALRECEALEEDTDERTRRGAKRLIRALSARDD
ncbi:hypothetical protein [Amycolatopsis silviterrae]|uniref:HEAT repeat domain-containing protein n=1 Tax=Amycolatopsis silviterrae TaxID=1656914 RepID=A0ABW5H8W1_9PSEU